MGVGRTLVLVMCAVGAVILLVLFTITSTSTILLYPSFYTTSLEASGFYEELSTTLNDLAAEQTLVFTKETLEGFVNRALDDVLAYIRSDTDTLTLAITIDEAIIRQSLEHQLAFLPNCAPGQVPATTDLTCIPQGTAIPDLFDVYLEQHNLDNASYTIDLADSEFLREGSDGREALDTIRDAVSLLYLLLFIYVIAFLVLCAILYLMMPAPKQNVILVFGIILLVGASFILTIGVIIKTLEQQYLILDDAFVQELVSVALSELLTQYYRYGFVLLVVGGIVTIIGARMHKQRRDTTIQNPKAKKT